MERRFIFRSELGVAAKGVKRAGIDSLRVYASGLSDIFIYILIKTKQEEATPPEIRGSQRKKNTVRLNKSIREIKKIGNKAN